MTNQTPAELLARIEELETLKEQEVKHSVKLEARIAELEADAKFWFDRYTASPSPDLYEKLKEALAAEKAKTQKAISKLKEKVLEHKQAYSLDIFPNSEILDDNSTRDSISAKMGRHMCDCFLKYIDELAQEGEG